MERDKRISYTETTNPKLKAMEAEDPIYYLLGTRLTSGGDAKRAIRPINEAGGHAEGSQIVAQGGGKQQS